MKRDKDLIRLLLLEVESLPIEYSSQTVSIEGYSSEDITYNLLLLHEANYIEAAVSKTIVGPKAVVPFRLTWEGHEFLDAVRDKTLWDKTKGVTQEARSGSFSVIKQVAIRIATNYAEEIISRMNYLG